MWPAIWMLPKDNAYGDWPRSGEIDIMETRGNGKRYTAQFVFFISAIHVKLTDIIYGELVLLQLNLVRIRREFVGEVPHIIWKCSGEK